VNAFLWFLLALGFGFLSYLFYTRQIRWLVSVIRNSVCGVGGILLFNFLFAGFGLSVGINALTVLIVGILGAPGFLLLYASQFLL